MDSQYNQPTFYDETVDPTDLFPPAQSLTADCLSDDIASYFSFDDTINGGSGATTPNYYPPSQDNEMADEAAEEEEEEQCEVKAAVVSKKSASSSGKPKRKYSASVTEVMAEAAVIVKATPAAAVQAVETKASKRAKKLAQIDVAAAVSMPESPFSLSPSFSSGSVSPAPSFSSANSSPSPPPSSGTSQLPVGDVDVGALLAESALKKSRLARKAELARLGRKRKNETIEKYSTQVERLQAEMRNMKATMERERKAHKRALKMALEANKTKAATSGSDGDEVTVKVEQQAAAAATVVVAAVKQPTDEVMAASQAALVALATFCKQRDIDTPTTTAACSALLNHMHTMAATHSGTLDGYRVALQRAAVLADGVSALVARFFASYSLQVEGEQAGDVTAVWQAMWQQPRGQVTEQQVDELNVWMKTVTE